MITTKSNQENLKNKFHGVEMSLEDNDSNYKLTTDNIQRIEMIKDKNTPVLFVYGGFFLRILKVVSLFCTKGFKSIWLGAILPVLKDIQMTITYSLKKINSAKEESEISIKTYLEKIESEQFNRKEQSKEAQARKESGKYNYEKDLALVFEGTPISITLISEEEFEKTSVSLEFDLSLYDVIEKKLSESKLITNLNFIKVSTSVDKKNVTNSIEFGLKISGEKWSKLFSSHISSEIFKRIEGYRGQVFNKHLVSLAMKKESFIFTFSHQRLDLFFESVSFDKVPGKIRPLPSVVPRDI